MRFLLSFTTIAVLFSSGAIAAADGPANKSGRTKNSQKSGKEQFVAFEVTPRHEETARQFVRQYHPELAELLEPLKAKRLKSYHRAIRDLYRAQQRLDKIRTNDMVRYELELRMWKVRSRVQLLSARLKVQDSSDLREQLRQSLEERIDIRIAMLQHQRSRMSQSLKKIDGQLKKLANGRDKEIERQLLQLTKTRKSKTGKNNQKKKPATKKSKSP